MTVSRQRPRAPLRVVRRRDLELLGCGEAGCAAGSVFAPLATPFAGAALWASFGGSCGEEEAGGAGGVVDTAGRARFRDGDRNYIVGPVLVVPVAGWEGDGARGRGGGWNGGFRNG